MSELTLKSIAAPPPWEALVLTVSSFPVPPEELASVRSFLRRLTGALLEDGELCVEIFLQFNHLHLADGAARIAENARAWRPEHGLGVWPDREPPVLWTRAEFESPPTGPPRPIMHKVLRLSGSRRVKNDAVEMMLGRGAVIEVLTAEPGDRFLERARKLLLPPIQERALRSFPFYVPLLERKSIGGRQADQLQDWLCGVSVYIRESAEDSGILIASRDPLAPVLKRIDPLLSNC